MKKIAVFLAPGFEDIEALTQVDTLRRASLDVITAAVGTPSLDVISAHGVTMRADCAVASLRADDLTAVILPGGLPGATNLAADKHVLTLCRDVASAGGIVAAICAAPVALAAAGLLKGRRYTCYPGIEAKIGGKYTAARTETDGNIVTGCGPGASFEFATAILNALGLAKQAHALKQGMLY